MRILSCFLLLAGPMKVLAETCLPGGGGVIELFSRDYRLEFSNGEEFKLKGVNWFVFETSLYVVHGLWAQTIDYFLDFLVTNKFNAVRLPLLVDVVLGDPKPPSYDFLSCFFDGDISSLEALDYLIARLGELGILVLFDQHRLNSGSISLCYADATHPEATIEAFWDVLIECYSTSWNVMGVDLKNEPHECEWQDWVNFAKRMGKKILQQVPRWLVFVEDIGANVQDEDRNCVTCNDGTFWGENLMGVCGYPVMFDSQEKLVYSPHVYGPSIYQQTYFSESGFPANMPDIWECHFGFLHRGVNSVNVDKNAVVVGEWGGEYTDSNKAKDRTWQDAYVAWHMSKGIPGTFY